MAIKQNSSFSPEILSSLAIGGVDGSLKDRMVVERPSFEIRAKSGSLTHISALAGYVKNKRGDEIAFAILARGLENFSGNFKEIEDKIALHLAEMDR